MRPLLPVLLIALVACGSEPPPALELTLYEQAAVTGPSEEHHLQVRVSRTASAFAPRGLRLQAQLRRPAALALLDLDVPLGQPSPTAAPRIVYTERDASGRLVFNAARAWGRIELSSDGGCPCQTGRFELLLTDPGEDGQLDTTDDKVRRLSRARLRRGARPFCHARVTLDIRAGMLVVGSRGCPARGHVATGSACAWSGTAWVADDWNQDGWYDLGWAGEWSDGWDDGWQEGEWPSDIETDDAAWPADDGWGQDSWGQDGQDSWDQGWDESWGEEETTDTGSSDGWSDDGWSDDGSSDDGWSDGWSDDGWSDDGWSDDGSGDDWGDDGSDDEDWW